MGGLCQTSLPAETPPDVFGPDFGTFSPLFFFAGLSAHVLCQGARRLRLARVQSGRLCPTVFLVRFASSYLR